MTFRFAILSFLVVALTACGTEADLELYALEGHEDAIINGKACDESEYPTSVAIITDADMAFGGFEQAVMAVSCTGTLIAPDVVLTAAHCLDATLMTMGMGEISRVEYYVTTQPDLTAYAGESGAGEAALPPPEGAIRAAWFLGHPSFDINTMQDVSGPGDYRDVGLIFLETPIEGVTPAIVIGRDEVDQIKAGISVGIAGWGQQTQGSGNPWEGPEPGTVGIKYCAESTVNEVGSMEMQVGSDVNSSRKCHGDSGGPTYMDVETTSDVKRRVIGITSHAYDQSDCAKGGVDTRVDSWLSWIDEQMNGGCADGGERVWCDVPGIIPASYYNAPVEPEGTGSGDGEKSDEEGGCAQVPLSGAFLWLGLGFLVWRQTIRR